MVFYPWADNWKNEEIWRLSRDLGFVWVIKKCWLTLLLKIFLGHIVSKIKFMKILELEFVSSFLYWKTDKTIDSHS